MMMTVGPKMGITSNPLETGAVDGTVGPAGAGDMFLRLLAGIGKPLTVEGGEEAPSGAPTAPGTQENLTIKTFRKLLGANPEETEPELAAGEDELTQGDAEKLVEEAETAILSLPAATAPSPAERAVISAQPMNADTAAKVAPAVATLLTGVAASRGGGSPHATGASVTAMLIAEKTSADFTIPVADSSDIPMQQGADLKVPLMGQAATMAVTEQLKAASVKLPDGDAGAVQTASAETAAPVEAPAVEGRLAANSGSSNVPTFLSAPLQPAAVTQPSEAAAATARPGEIVDPALEQQLDLAHEGEWLDRLARDIARSAGAEGGLRFRLNPEHLGTLHVQLTQGDAGASLRLTADSEAARAIIADAQPRLVAEARAQGVRIAETHVDLGAGGHSASGEQRRQESDRPQAFVRTDGAGVSPESEAAASAVNASERYA